MRTGPRFEAFLAALYTNTALQQVFLGAGGVDAVVKTAREAGLTEDEARAVAGVDREALRRTCESLARKRSRSGH